MTAKWSRKKGTKEWQIDKNPHGILELCKQFNINGLNISKDSLSTWLKRPITGLYVILNINTSLC